MVQDRLQLNLIFSLINNFCYLVLSSAISAVETGSLSESYKPTNALLYTIKY